MRASGSATEAPAVNGSVSPLSRLRESQGAVDCHPHLLLSADQPTQTSPAATESSGAVHLALSAGNAAAAGIPRNRSWAAIVQLSWVL